MRGAVTLATADFLEREATEQGRSRTWHAGSILEGFCSVMKKLPSRQRVQLDWYLRHPDALYEILAPHLKVTDELELPAHHTRP